jgi:hypothetical protein
VWDVAPHPQATDREGPGSFREHEFLARAVLDNLYKFILPARHRLAIARCTACGSDEGRLKAAKAPDGTWRSSKVWVDEYVATRYKRA